MKAPALFPLVTLIGAVWPVRLQAAAPATPDPRLIAHWDVAAAQTAAQGQALADLSGNGNNATLNNVTVMRKVEELVEHPCLYFDGSTGHAAVADSRSLNPNELTR
jgi:hypothetical protein